MIPWIRLLTLLIDSSRMSNPLFSITKDMCLTLYLLDLLSSPLTLENLLMECFEMFQWLGNSTNPMLFLLEWLAPMVAILETMSGSLTMLLHMMICTKISTTLDAQDIDIRMKSMVQVQFLDLLVIAEWHRLWVPFGV